jgi:nucleoside recognition membrane protein YjiH
LTISFIFIVFFYIHELKKKKCECSVSDTRKVLEIVNYIHLGLLGLVIIALIYAIFSGVDLFNVVDKKGKKAVKVRK